MTIFGPKKRVCAICSVGILSEDDTYEPKNYQELLLCGGCGREFRKWEMMERQHRGHISIKICKCGRLMDAHFDHRKKFNDAKWTGDKILSEIKAAERAGTIHRCYVENKALVRAAERRFGGWKRAIRAARARFYGNNSPKNTPHLDV